MASKDGKLYIDDKNLHFILGPTQVSVRTQNNFKTSADVYIFYEPF